uniref:Integrase catalytic domain-containing protein n=1 Tax=Lactuca sativa TaxID=4236 RepID=A0A9R1X4N7_LACSA|nr:hypothetical protein LSAT_V11C700365440 [Lactuca sativa]
MMIPVDPLKPEANKELWKLYTNGATSKEGSGAGLILQSPKGEDITYALRFDFQVSNIKAVYKALLAVGPFLLAPGGMKFLLVVMDYFTKWIEAEPLATVIGKQMINFMTKNNLARFGTPRILTSDNGTQLEGSSFKEWCEDKKIHRRFTSVAHPQANGQTKISNKTIVNGLKKRLLRLKSSWVDELPTVLWSYHTIARSSIGKIPFSLTYGIEAVLP